MWEFEVERGHTQYEYHIEAFNSIVFDYFLLSYFTRFQKKKFVFHKFTCNFDFNFNFNIVNKLFLLNKVTR